MMEQNLNILASEKLPPSPKLTHQQLAFMWYMKPLDLLAECRHTLGSSFILNLGTIGNHVFFSQPNTVAEILKTDPTLSYKTNDREFMLPFLGQNSLFLLQGEKHLVRRRLLSPPFHTNKIQSYGGIIQALTLNACQEWPLNQGISLLDSMFELSLRIIFDIIFGLNNVNNAEEIKTLIRYILKVNRAGAVFLKPHNDDAAINKLHQDFYSKKEKLDGLLLELIEEKQQKATSLDTDILSALIQCHDENNQPLTAIEIKDHLMTLLVAGHETTATAIAWAIYWIHENSKIKDRLLTELASTSSLDEINNNAYLHAVCQETLRIIPIVAVISRTLKIPLQFENYLIPEGMSISIPIFLLHRDNTIYPEAEIFRPERFLEKKFSMYEYLPFGGGTRTCIGMRLALYQMKIVLATLLSYFNIQLLGTNGIKTVRKGIVIAPAEGVMVQLSKK